MAGFPADEAISMPWKFTNAKEAPTTGDGLIWKGADPEKVQFIPPIGPLVLGPGWYNDGEPLTVGLP